MRTPTRVVSSLPTGTGLTRFVIAKSLGAAGQDAAAQMKDTPHVLPLLKADAEWLTEAGVDAMTTTDSGAAAPLVQYGVVDEVLQLLRGASGYDQLKPRMRRVPPAVTFPRELTGLTAGWIGEGAPMPISNNAYAALRQDIHKLGCAPVLSRELLRVNPVSEAVVRQSIIAGIASGTDSQLLDPTITAIPAVRPASITNGATAIPSTGGTPAQIAADLANLIQSVTTPQTMLTWIMRPRTANTISARMLTVGTVLDISRNGLLGHPVILSEGSPRQITLVDGGGIVYRDEGLSIDVATHGSVEMRTDTRSPVTASVVHLNLWQTNHVAVKALRWLSRQRAVPGSVAYMTTTY